MSKEIDDSWGNGTFLLTIDGNKLICVQTAKKEGEKSTKSTREFTEEGCKYIIEVTGTDVVSTQVFKRI